MPRHCSSSARTSDPRIDGCWADLSAGYWGHGSSGDAAGGADAGQAGRRAARRRPGASSPSGTASATIVFRDGDEVELGSRNERPMTRYFPEVVAGGARPTCPRRCVVDGEIVVPDADGRRLDFEALLLAHPPRGQPGQRSWPSRPRPASSPSTCSPWTTVATWPSRSPSGGRPWSRRWPTCGPPVHLTPATTDRTPGRRVAVRSFEGAGLDGLVAKALDGVYEPDRRS